MRLIFGDLNLRIFLSDELELEVILFDGNDENKNKDDGLNI